MSIDLNSISLTTEQKLYLAQFAQRTGKEPSQILDQIFERHPLPSSLSSGNGSDRTLYDAFLEDGSIGLIKTGPTDVSSNPKYLEGFGSSGV